MVSIIKNIQTGIIYENDIPHVVSKHAAHPSICVLDNGEILATAVIGQAFESVDSHTWLFRSSDNGLTWNLQGRLTDTSIDEFSSDICRLSVAPDGTVILICHIHDRSRKNSGLTNPDNTGFVDTKMYISRSKDYGRTWDPLLEIIPPIIGPVFESQSAVVFLSDGRWLLPTMTWRGWDGFCPNGMMCIAFVSLDQGKTWPQYMTVMDGTLENSLFYESTIVELPNKKLLATAWGYNEISGNDLPNQYAISQDGIHFSPYRSCDIFGQTMSTIVLQNGLLLNVYRLANHETGLWANIARLENDEWINIERRLLWTMPGEHLAFTDGNMSRNFSRLRFGAPRMCILSDNSVFVAFWCYENNNGIIRWYNIKT